MKRQLVFDLLRQVDLCIRDYHWKVSITEKEHQLRWLVLTLLAANTISVSWFSTRELNWRRVKTYLRGLCLRESQMKLWSCTDNMDPQKVIWQFFENYEKGGGDKRTVWLGGCSIRKWSKSFPFHTFTENWEPPEVSLPLCNSHDCAI